MCFEQSSYTAVKANESVEVCIVMIPEDCSAVFPFNIRFRTVNDSAGT